jgi:hypothetical protein
MLAATNNSINLARDEFISTNRPKLIVRQFQIDPVTPGNPITIHFAMVNIGNTEARPQLLGCQIALWNVQGNYFEAPGINPVQSEINVPPIAGGQRVSWRTVEASASGRPLMRAPRLSAAYSRVRLIAICTIMAIHKGGTEAGCWPLARRAQYEDSCTRRC